jgi:3-oxo-5-alpha-steroid 4-dehydrogenase 3
MTQLFLHPSVMASFLAQGIDAALEATGMDAVDALRAFFLLAAATVCDENLLQLRCVAPLPRALMGTTGS